MMPFDCTSEKRGDVVVVTPVGDIDRDTAPQLRDVLTEAVGQVVSGRVEVELRHVDFLDSSGVGALLAAHRLATSRGTTVQVHGANPMVRRVLEITNVWDLLAA